MIMNPVPIDSAVRDADNQRLVETERQNRFRWNMNSVSASDDLQPRSGGRSSSSTDRGAFASSGDCADDGSQRCAAADMFSSTAVFAHASSAFRLDSLRLGF